MVGGLDSNDNKCMECMGTGRFQGKFSGPGWPNCPRCKGSGLTRPHYELSELVISHQQAIIKKLKRQQMPAAPPRAFLKKIIQLKRDLASYRGALTNAEKLNKLLTADKINLQDRISALDSENTTGE